MEIRKGLGNDIQWRMIGVANLFVKKGKAAFKLDDILGAEAFRIGYKYANLRYRFYKVVKMGLFVPTKKSGKFYTFNSDLLVQYHKEGVSAFEPSNETTVTN